MNSTKRRYPSSTTHRHQHPIVSPNNLCITLAAAVLYGTACDTSSTTIEPSETTPITRPVKSSASAPTQYIRATDDGLFVVNGDILVSSEESAVKAGLIPDPKNMNALTFVDTGSSTIASWPFANRKGIKYCVSTAFNTFSYAEACRTVTYNEQTGWTCTSANMGIQPSAHNAIVTAMNHATSDWHAESGVKFVYDATSDSSCDASNTSVDFHVEPANLGNFAYAQAGFPNESRSARRIRVGVITFFDGTYSIEGILKHELGHTLGLRHEVVRSPAAACQWSSACCDQYLAESSVPFRPLYSFDNASIMMYPSCTGIVQNLVSTVSADDRRGLRAVYGPRSLSRPAIAINQYTTGALHFFRGPPAASSTLALSSIGSTSASPSEIQIPVSIAEQGYSAATYDPSTGTTRFFTAKDNNTLTSNGSLSFAAGAEFVVAIDINDDLLSDLLLIDRDSSTTRLYTQRQDQLGFTAGSTMSNPAIANWVSVASGWNISANQRNGLSVISMPITGTPTVAVYAVSTNGSLSNLLAATSDSMPDTTSVFMDATSPSLHGIALSQSDLTNVVAPATPLFTDGTFQGLPIRLSVAGYVTAPTAIPDARKAEVLTHFSDLTQLALNMDGEGVIYSGSGRLYWQPIYNYFSYGSGPSIPIPENAKVTVLGSPYLH